MSYKITWADTFGQWKQATVMVRLVGALCQQRERGPSQTYPKDFSLCWCGTDEHHTGTFWIKEIINALKAFSGCKFYPVEPLYTCKLKIKPAFIGVISETIQIVKLCSICKIVNVSVRQYLKEQLPRDFIQGLPTASRAVINIDDTRKPHR
ncbi:hypothetical protein OUZ56_011055 [Daphnia magna]|uniref:Uncharacterized protein n=1 Tax=Daphnia magna TaxID=35525 RepID=A0ABQ9YZ54_9CRUS|nr:hypothetical protein OUZ56_011055 [Daphnia magna]